MTPVCCGDLPDGKVLDDHKQISIKGKNGHKAEPAQDPASTMMMGGFKVVHTVKEGGLWWTTNPVRPNLLSESG
jgi:hypothetical protein